MSSPCLKLTYFDIPGRAEATRIAFFLGGVPFEDVRFQMDQVAKYKETSPYGVFPTIQINDEVLGESSAIARYAARLSGLYPIDNPSAALLVDEAMLAVDQFGEQFRPWWTAPTDEAKKACETKLLTTIIPQSFAYVDGILEKISEHPSFMDPSRLFLHDLWVHSFVAVFLRPGFIPFLPDNVMEGYTYWHQCIAKVNNHPRVQEWNALQTLRATSVTLVSRPFNGREGPIRLALERGGAGVKFECITLPDTEAFAKRYPTLPATQSLVLEVNGQPVATQATAALIYVGKLTGLYPVNDPLAALRIDEVFGVVEAFYNALLSTLTQTDSVAAKQENTEILKHLSGLDKRLKQRGGEYATGGSTLSVADLAIHGVVSLLKSDAMSYVSTTEFPTLLGIYDRVTTALVTTTP